WPPSKPLMRTPVRAFWPLTPRPEVLPRPEPMPRPRRFLRRRAPGLSRISFNLMSLSSGRLVDAHQMVHAANHAAHRRRVLELAGAMQLVEAEPLQGVALGRDAPDRAADLGHAHGFLAGCRLGLRLGHRLLLGGS